MFVRRLAEAEAFTCAGIRFGMLLPRDVTGSVEIVQEILEPGQETPVDQHATFDQVFLIQRGEGRLMIGGDFETVSADVTAYIPRGTPHSIRCTSAEPLEYLYINVWGSRIPEPEQNWRQVYSVIHDRRAADVAAQGESRS